MIGGTRRAQRAVPRVREGRIAPPQRVGRLPRQPDAGASPPHVAAGGKQFKEPLPMRPPYKPEPADTRPFDEQTGDGW